MEIILRISLRIENIWRKTLKLGYDLFLLIQPLLHLKLCFVPIVNTNQLLSVNVDKVIQDEIGFVIYDVKSNLVVFI